MKVAVISDIHANLQALEAVLGEIDRDGHDEIWCLGDAVGYGANPNEVVEILAERCSLLLIGNHDLAALNLIEITNFSVNAAEAALWTRRNLAPDTVATLESIEGARATREAIGLSHASPRDPVWEYVIDTSVAEENIDFQPERVGLIGHSHIALFFTRPDEMSRISAAQAPAGTVLSLVRGEWLVNPGSVGQPRDGDPRAAWLTLDTESMRAEYRRTEYPVEVAAEAIREAALPPALAERLFAGT